MNSSKKLTGLSAYLNRNVSAITTWLVLACLLLLIILTSGCASSLPPVIVNPSERPPINPSLLVIPMDYTAIQSDSRQIDVK